MSDEHTSQLIRRILLGAADYLLEHGWQRGTSGGKVGSHFGPACAFGAISSSVDLLRHAMTDREILEMEDAALRVANAHLRALHPDREGSGGLYNLVLFNDESSRTMEDVVAILRGAAAGCP